jgi:hypothetical protein
VDELDAFAKDLGFDEVRGWEPGGVPMMYVDAVVFQSHTGDVRVRGVGENTSIRDVADGEGRKTVSWDDRVRQMFPTRSYGGLDIDYYVLDHLGLEACLVPRNVADEGLFDLGDNFRR